MTRREKSTQLARLQNKLDRLRRRESEIIAQQESLVREINTLQRLPVNG